ncbi:MAG: ErfK/YbiS/YcfS/YnhG family protein [Cyanobacteria bacterium RYN_339]|nr:ErfK/YbiS/YcfS/YnhG family protein [Cyanobacteria bacterium RYN_339]
MRQRLAFLGVAACLTGFRTLDPDSNLHLSAQLLPQGGVELAWTVPPAATQGLTLRRAHDPTDPDSPAITWVLPATPTGRYVDAGVADGMTYAYALDAGAIPGQRIEVVLPARALPVSRRPALWIDKGQYTLAVMADGQALKRYPIALGRLPKHRKLAFDNASTPEGLYHVQAAQFHAKYFRAFDLDYPNALDRVRYGLLAPPAPIGGEIQIHGRGITRNWTYGCIALRDADMNELFAHPEIGRGTEVRIWGGDLLEADVAALAAGARSGWRRTLAGWDGKDGPSFWLALGRYQQAAHLPVSCLPDARTAASLGI